MPKHPNWKMEKQLISYFDKQDFEVIEAKNIFNIPYNKIKILIHPKSTYTQ